jgi:hypothetical protein
VLAAQSDSFVVDVSTQGSYTEGGIRYSFSRLLLLFYDRGQLRVSGVIVLLPKEMQHHWSDRWDVEFAFDRVMFLAPDSPRLLLTLKVGKATIRSWHTRIDLSFPGLYFWDGKTLSLVPWQRVWGMDTATAVKALESKGEHVWSQVQAKTIGLWRISGPVSGVGVLLPAGGPTGPRWFVGSNSVNGQLEQSPQFQVADRTVTIANVIAWRSPKEALVQLEDGFFLLTNTADVR